MAIKYAVQQQGVADGSVTPANKADGRQVNANKRVLIASKEAGVAWNSADTIYLGKKPAGTTITDIKLVTDTSFGTATVDIGDGSTADKYVDGATLTTVDVPTSIGPNASTVDDVPMDAEEELWATIGVANVAAATIATLIVEYSSIS